MLLQARLQHVFKHEGSGSVSLAALRPNRRCHTTTMDLFGLPIEIRLKIYSELLLRSVLIHVRVTYNDWPNTTPRTTPKYVIRVEGPQGQRLPLRFEPALLRVNKQVHSEACQVLYSENRFGFPGCSAFSLQEFGRYIDGYLVAPFLGLIGSHAGHLRHICFPWPTFNDYRFGKVEYAIEARNLYNKTLELIRERCTSLTTLKLEICLVHQYFEPFGAEELDFLDPRLAAIPSLKNVIVQIQDCSGERKFREGSIEMLTDRGWVVKFIGPDL